MDGKTVFFLVLGLVGFYLMLSAFTAPWRWFWRLFWATVLGLGLLTLLNWLGAGLQLHVAVNPVTVLAVGFYPVGGTLLLALLALAGLV
ncbi:pro-sigmaK processing inhibitor BofA family protein [Desulfothermobacter acidiphilus]|uniref:pro-sigmaK processing inhibitor BofA family protein n=1 Tax=Desulfothermobacter acidiphilus TaxID=1938353 RepID=UPI003F8AB835